MQHSLEVLQCGKTRSSNLHNGLRGEWMLLLSCKVALLTALQERRYKIAQRVIRTLGHSTSLSALQGPQKWSRSWQNVWGDRCKEEMQILSPACTLRYPVHSIASHSLLPLPQPTPSLVQRGSLVTVRRHRFLNTPLSECGVFLEVWKWVFKCI
jgi:hypothetical protein